MVVRCQRMMEDEEDLEALRLAALQTIKPRQAEPKKMYSHQYFNKYNQYPGQQNKKPFIRTDYHNPNLIVIVPTEDDKLTQPPPAQKSPEVLKNGSSSRDRAPVEASKDDKKSGEVVEQKKTSSKGSSAKEIQPESSPSKVLPKSKRDSKDKDKDDVMELHFNDDELDFESECVDHGNAHEDEAVDLHVDESDTLSLHADDSDALALHDEDEDSLEKLMDEMEQEFSEETGHKNRKSSKKVLQKKATLPGVVKKTRPTSERRKENQKSNSPTLPASSEKKLSPIQKYPSPKRVSPPRRVSPLRRNSPKRSPPHRLSPRRTSRSPRPYGAPRSPIEHISTSPSYRRSRSPARTPPPLLRRSPLSRRSRSPQTKRSRSPFSRRSKSPYRRASPYCKSKSPVRRRTPPPRRFSPLPRRSPRRSPPPLTRRSRSRTRSPPRREYRSRTPVQPRRRSRSPSFLRRSLSKERRRPIRRSVSPRKRSLSPLLGRTNVRRRTPPLLPPSRRSPPQTRPARRRSVTPPRRTHPRRLSPRRQPRPTRVAELQSRTDRPIRGPSPPPSDGRMETDYRREPLKKLLPDEENDKKADVPAADVNPKLEARRKKFEMNAPLSLTQKKLYLKASSDETVDPTENKHRQRLEDVAEELKINERTKHSPTLFQSPPRVHKVIRTDDLEQSSNLSAISTKGSQTKSLHYEQAEKEVQRMVKPTAIRYTVEDAKEEIELMKLKRRRKTEQILEEEGENQQIMGIKKKKKKEKKEKKRSKKKEAELGEMIEMKSKTSRSGTAAAVGRVGASEGQDLRAELSRRRAQRLQGQPGSRLIQSALEGVVADKKIKGVRRDSPPQEGSTVDDANKSKARRVHVVPLGSKKKYEDPVEVSSSSASDSRMNSSGEEIDDDDSSSVRKTARMTASGILRGTTLRRRNQV